ncbi:universal stress protein, partial [Streptomyces sp. SM12]|uniref:universal stress protein n=1 Tax=Streptomyces sp. SM12 TaxID=1071602 RepID=UPI0035B5CA53
MCRWCCGWATGRTARARPDGPSRRCCRSATKPGEREAGTAGGGTGVLKERKRVETMDGPVVVGVDDAPGMPYAVDWAAAEAVRTGRPLRLVHAAMWRRDGREGPPAP